LPSLIGHNVDRHSFLRLGGENEGNGTGVVGFARDVGATGVVGISKVRDPDVKKKASSIGIVGATEAGRGFGVVGLSVGELAPPEQASDIPRVGRDEEGRVVVQSPAHFSGGIGVLGASGSETGVLGLAGSRFAVELSTGAESKVTAVMRTVLKGTRDFLARGLSAEAAARRKSFSTGPVLLVLQATVHFRPSQGQKTPAFMGSERTG
jgi:hypothetical protein